MLFTIRTKLLFAFFVLLVPLFILAGISYYNQQVIYEEMVGVEILSEEIAYFSSLQSAIDKVIMPPNDYLITGDFSEKEKFRNFISDAERMINSSSELKLCHRCHPPPYQNY